MERSASRVRMYTIGALQLARLRKHVRYLGRARKGEYKRFLWSHHDTRRAKRVLSRNTIDPSILYLTGFINHVQYDLLVNLGGIL